MSEEEKKGNGSGQTRGGDELFHDLFDGTPEAAALAQGEIAVFRSRSNPRGYDFMTPGIEKLTGYAPANFTPEVWDELVQKVRMRGELAGVPFEEARRRYYDGEVSRWSAECLIRHRNGTERWILDLKVPLRDASGRVIGSFGFLQDITAQRLAGLGKAQKLELHFNALAGHLPAVIWTTDSNLVCLTCEGAGLLSTGAKGSDIVGRNILDVLGTSQEAAPGVKAHQDALNGRSVDYALEWSGRSFVAHLEPTRSSDGSVTGLLGMAVDVTAHREAESKLIQREAYENALLQAIPDLIAVLDEERNYLDFKAEARLAEVFPAEKVIGRNMSDFTFNESDRPVVHEAIRQALSTGRVQHIEYRFVEPDRETWWDARIARLDARRVVVVSRDITERKNAEVERRRIEEQIRSAQQLESLGVLAGGIAHDFNNLLVGILGNAELVLKELPAGAVVADGVGEIRQAALRAAELTNLMLAYAGRGKFQTAILDLNVVACEVTQLVQAAISKKVTLHFELDRTLPSIRGDVAQLRQVIMNLVINGAEAIGEREGEIHIRTGIAEIDMAQTAEVLPVGEVKPGRYVFLEVRDNGCGMDAATRRRIFDPFFTTKFTGRGLGLSASLGILRSHSGAVHVESETGMGSVFTIFIPPSSSTATSSDAIVVLHSRPAAAPEPSASRNRVLAVDDEEIVRRVVKRQLERNGFRVLVEQDGRQAVQLLASQPDLIDVVLLDLTMPGMGGEEVLLYLRTIGFKHPVVLMSGYDESEASNIATRLNVHSFLRKPFAGDALVQALRSALASA